MLDMAKRFFGSTKAVVMIASLIALVGGWCSIEIPKEDQTKAAGAVAVLGTVIVGAWIRAQGQADHGKNAKPVETNLVVEVPDDVAGGGAE